MFCHVAETLVITISRGTCIHGNIVKHISLTHRHHNFQRGFQKVIIIRHWFYQFWITSFMQLLINLSFFSKHTTWYLIALHFAWRFLLLLHLATKSSLLKKWFGRRFFKKNQFFVQKISWFSVCAIKSAYFLLFFDVKRIAVLEEMFVHILIKSDISQFKIIFFECNAFRLAIPILFATSTVNFFM